MSFEESEKYEYAQGIVDRLVSRGHRALFVGGWVRDVMVLGVARDRDIDIATSAHPEEIQALFPRTIGIGEKFGVVLVVENGVPFEVATFRKDMGYTDGRHPDEVAYSDSPEEDVLRRDFTCNGLFYDPLSGDMLDFVDGVGDIKRKVLRCIGEPGDRFDEDYLRMLRAARFAKQLGFAMDEKTRQAILARSSLITEISAERIREEVKRIVAPPGGGLGLRTMDSLGLLEAVLPEVHAMKGVAQPPEFHPEGDVFEHTCLTLDNISSDSVPLAMAALLHDTGKPATAVLKDRIRFSGHCLKSAEITASVMARLRFSNLDAEETVDLVAHHMDFVDVEKMRPATLKRLLRKDNAADHLELHRADCLASHGRLDHYEFAAKALAGMTKEDLKPPPLITGMDLIEIGLEPGPVFRTILSAVEEAQLDGRMKTREEALSEARRIASAEGRA